MAELFRKKSMEKIASPENLSDYIRINDLSIWIILTGAALLLAGGVLWGVTGQLDTVLSTAAVVQDHRAFLLIPESEAAAVQNGTAAKIEDVTVSVSTVAERPVQLTDAENAYALHVGGYSPEEWLYIAEAETDLKDGVYPAYVTTETVSPISFLFN